MTKPAAVVGLLVTGCYAMMSATLMVRTGNSTFG